MRSAACPPLRAAAWACDRSAAACVRRGPPPAAWPSWLRRQRARVGRRKAGRQMIFDEPPERGEFGIQRDHLAHVLQRARQVCEIAALAIAPEQPREYSQHLDVPLQSNEIEPAQ